MRALVSIILACLALSSFASDASTMTINSETEAVIKKNMAKLGLTPIDISPSPVDGLFQVLTERGLFYISENGQHLIHGKAYDLSNGIVNITETALAKVRVVGIKKFKDSMIVFPANNEKHKITVFTDVSC